MDRSAETGHSREHIHIRLRNGQVPSDQMTIALYRECLLVLSWMPFSSFGKPLTVLAAKRDVRQIKRSYPSV